MICKRIVKKVTRRKISFLLYWILIYGINEEVILINNVNSNLLSQMMWILNTKFSLGFRVLESY